MFAKQGLRSLATVFFVLGAMFFAVTGASAQTLTKSVAPPSTQNLMNATDAVNTLKNQVGSIHNALPTLSGPTLKKETMRVQYYKSLIVHISEGMSVAEALSSTLPDAVIQDPAAVTIEDQLPILDQLYLEAILLLTV